MIIIMPAGASPVRGGSADAARTRRCHHRRPDGRLLPRVHGAQSAQTPPVQPAVVRSQRASAGSGWSGGASPPSEGAAPAAVTDGGSSSSDNCVQMAAPVEYANCCVDDCWMVS